MRVIGRALARVTDLLAARRVAPESIALAAVVVSIAAGVALAAGGAIREPRVWLVVPALGVARLALFVIEGRLVDCRADIPRQKERFCGKW